MQDKATWRWRGGALHAFNLHRLQRLNMQALIEGAEAAGQGHQEIVHALIPHAAGEGHLEVAWWGPCMHGILRRRRLGGGVVVPHVSEEKATSRWRGGPHNRHQLHMHGRLRRRSPSRFGGEGHLKVARWSPQQASVPHAWQAQATQSLSRRLQDKATSRWRGGPCSRHQLHSSTGARLELLHRPTRPPQGGEVLHVL
ncbi:hypothetical protein V6N13_056994 [Hibiscus sabdariffa]|uniref:Uncharacterized protein n=2 Tax=Hibiscus sabdariffa TaxID=183260 RepID=A0ABR2D2M3_9ROSI